MKNLTITAEPNIIFSQSFYGKRVSICGYEFDLITAVPITADNCSDIAGE